MLPSDPGDPPPNNNNRVPISWSEGMTPELEAYLRGAGYRFYERPYTENKTADSNEGGQ